MTLTVDIEPRPHYLYAAVSGEFSLTAAQAVYDQVVHAALPLAQARILIDARYVTGKPSQEERYALGLFVATEQRLMAGKSSFEPQVAVLGRQPLVDPNRFGETVAVNRGAKVKVSERLEEALHWLGVRATG
jgi:hypothetical protein